MKSFRQIELEALAEGKEFIRRRIQEKLQEEKEKEARQPDGIFSPSENESNSKEQTDNESAYLRRED